MDKVKISVVGAGLIGRRHIELIGKSEKAEVASIVDPDSSAKEFSASLGVDWYPDIASMLEAASPNGVILATPNHLHVPDGLACVAAGVPALIEKPISNDGDQAEQLVAAADAANVPLLVGHHRRHNPIIKAAKAQIDAGKIGNVVALHGSFWIYKHDAYFDAEWRTQLGAGPVYINLIHDVDLMRHLVGEIIEVQAFRSNTVRRFAVEDTAAILMRFENGAIGTLSVSDTIVSPWSWELSAAENSDYPAMEQNNYLIGGTHGSIEIPRGRIWSQKERSWWKPMDVETYSVEKADPLVLQIEQFCEVIKGEAKPLVTAREGLKSLRVVEAVVKAAETGQTVQVG